MSDPSPLIVTRCRSFHDRGRIEPHALLPQAHLDDLLEDAARARRRRVAVDPAPRRGPTLLQGVLRRLWRRSTPPLQVSGSR